MATELRETGTFTTRVPPVPSVTLTGATETVRLTMTCRVSGRLTSPLVSPTVRLIVGVPSGSAGCVRVGSGVTTGGPPSTRHVHSTTRSPQAPSGSVEPAPLSAIVLPDGTLAGAVSRALGAREVMITRLVSAFETSPKSLRTRSVTSKAPSRPNVCATLVWSVWMTTPSSKSNV